MYLLASFLHASVQVKFHQTKDFLVKLMEIKVRYVQSDKRKLFIAATLSYKHQP